MIALFLQLAGIAALIAAAYMVAPALALAVAGVACLVAGVLEDRR